jgi:hypothetical protein
MSKDVNCSPSSSEPVRLVAGPTSIEKRELMVPFYVPLAPSMAVADVVKLCPQIIQDAIESGSMWVLAVAEGEREGVASPRPVKMILLYGRMSGDPFPHFIVYDSCEDEWGANEDMNELKFLFSETATRDEVAAYWIWNNYLPDIRRRSRYQFRYSLVEY